MKYTINDLLLIGEKANKRDLLTELVQSITKDTKLYSDESDLELLEKLLEACIKENMEQAVSKMYSNIGKYFYHKNMVPEAFHNMEKALSISNIGKYNDLRVINLSELGLLYFYELKYETAKELFDKAQRLLKSSENLDSDTVFSLYYRSGILHNYMGMYHKSSILFKKAWEYALEEVDKGRVLMNIGVGHKKRGQFKMAEGCYAKALEIFKAEGVIQECDIYNNIAELHKVTGKYDKALEYIQKAFICLSFREIQRYFVYYQTYIEIKILKGEVSQYLEMLVELLSGVREYSIHKYYIVDAFASACKCIPEEKEVLKHLREEIANTIEMTACNNEDYKNELVKCLADVCLSLKLLNSY